MKYIKILIALLIFMLCTVVAEAAGVYNYEVDMLNKIGILSDDVINSGEDEYLTREQAAVILSNLCGANEQEPCETGFEDVPAKSENSGYIAYAINRGLMKGTGSRTFSPEEKVEFYTLLKAAVKLIGYDSLAKSNGGQYADYRNIASKYSWLDGVRVDGAAIKVQDAVRFIRNVVFSEYNELQISNGGYNFADKKSVLKELLGIEAYYAKITDSKKDSTKVEIERALNDAGDAEFRQGEVTTLSLAEGVDAGYYQYSPVVIYVCDAKIVYIHLKKDTSILYDYIYSVNGDTEEGNSYRKDFIKEIELYDGLEYDISSDITVCYNEEFTEAPVAFVGKFARIVMENEEILHIDVWDMQEGGLITGLENAGIVYTQRTANNVHLKNIREYEKCVVTVNGQKASYVDLHKNMVFDYYLDEESGIIIIAANEKVISDKLMSIGGDYVQVGLAGYWCNYSDLYYSKNGTDFSLYSNDANILNFDVSVFIDLKGYARYIKVLGENNSSKEFVGAVLSVFMDDANEKHMMKIKYISDNFSENIYTVSENVRLGDGVIIEDMHTARNSFDAKCIYKFRTNFKGEIIQIDNMKPFLDAEAANNMSISTFQDSSTASATIDGRKVFLNSVSLCFMYEINDEYKIEYVSFESLRSRTADGCYMSFLSEEDTNKLDYVVVHGNVSNIHMPSYMNYYALVTKKSKVLVDDEIQEKITILSKNGEEHIYVDEREAREYQLNQFIEVVPGYRFAESEIRQSGAYSLDLSGDIEEWTMTDGTGKGLRRGTVKSISDKVLILEDGSEKGYLYYFSPGSKMFITVGKQNARERFVKGNITDISPGSEIVYFLSGGAISYVFYSE